MSYLLAFVGFALLIILHEFGHFLAAKAVGMRVERFALFFPPLIFKWRKPGSETEYGIGAIPLGGYVKITGMNPAEEIPPEVEHRAYYKQKVWKRIVVIAAGPLVNVVLAFLILWGVFAFNGRETNVGLSVLQTQSEPAASKLKPDDRILSVDGVKGYAPGLSDKQIEARTETLRKTIGRHACAPPRKDGCVAAKPATFVVQRDGRTLTLPIAPRYDSAEKRMLVGFAFGRHEDLAVGAAAGASVTGMWRVTEATVDNVVKLFYDQKARDQVSGVVGSFEATRKSFEFDTVSALTLLALISLSLAIINLFPFLPLDGGHIFWAVAEKVRGRAIPFRVMERAGVVGFMLVLVLFYIGLSNDIGRLSSGQGFGVR